MIIFFLIFLIILIVFYIIISNLGINYDPKINKNIKNKITMTNLEKKISFLKSELSHIKNKLNNSTNNSSELLPVSDLIIKSQPPIIKNLKNNLLIQQNQKNQQNIPDQKNTHDQQNTLGPQNQQNIPNQQNIQNQQNRDNRDNQDNQDNPNTNKNDNNECHIITIPQQTDNKIQNKNLINKPPPIIYDPIANYDKAKLFDPFVDPSGRTSADQIPTPQVAMQLNFPTQGVLDKYHRIGLLVAITNNVKKKRSKNIELPYSTSDNSESSACDSNESFINTDSDSDILKGREFIWNGPSKTNINKRKKRYVKMENKEKKYNGIEIKENFSDLDSLDSVEYFGNTNKAITNVYNIYSGNNDNNILELMGKKITDNWYKYFTSMTVGNKVIKIIVRNKNRKELYSGDIVFIPELNRSYRVKIDPMDMIEYNPYFF
jgi:hypothetical protein